ncbi:hypothetical protein FRC10_011606, partial [Ceratobasidium sp. 414]
LLMAGGSEPPAACPSHRLEPDEGRDERNERRAGGEPIEVSAPILWLRPPLAMSPRSSTLWTLRRPSTPLCDLLRFQDGATQAEANGLEGESHTWSKSDPNATAKLLGGA